MSTAPAATSGDLPVIDFQVDGLLHRIAEARETAADKMSAGSDAGKTQTNFDSGAGAKSLVDQMAAGAISRDLAQAFTWLPPIGPEGNPECRLGNRLHQYMNAKTEVERQRALEKLKEEVRSGNSPHAAELLKEVMTFDAGVRLHDAERQLAMGGRGENRDQLLAQKSQAIKDLASLAYADKIPAARTILERDPNVSEVLAARNEVLARQVPAAQGTAGGGGAPTDRQPATDNAHQTDAAHPGDAARDQPQISPAEAQARALVKDLGPSSSPEDYEKAAEALKKLGTPEAKAWGQWADANEQIADITKSAKDGFSLDADNAITKLTQEAKDGNPYARQALAAVLVSTGDATSINNWLDKYPSSDGKPVYVPNLNGFDSFTKAEFAFSCTNYFENSSFTSAPGHTLCASEMAAATIALGSVDPQSISAKTTIDKLSSLIQENLTPQCGPDQYRTPAELSAAMSGVIAGLDCGAKDSEALRVVISREAAQPAFTEQFPHIEELAREGNKTALRILADVAGGIADGAWQPGATTQPKSPLVDIALKDLRDLGQQPGKRADVVQAMLDTFNMHYGQQHTPEPGSNDVDRHGLGALMGKLASGLDGEKDSQLIDGVRGAFRKALDQMKFNRDTDDGYKSAADGMLAMAKLLKPEDIDTLLSAKNLTREVADAFVRNADDLSPDVRRYAISKLEQSLKTRSDLADVNPDMANEEKMSAIRALSGFAKYLNKDDIDLIASFGGDAAHNRGGTGGADRIRALGVTDDKIQEFQAVCGEALLYILARTPNAPEAQTGPREEAYSAFRDLPWPLRDGKGGYVPSEKSEQLKSALLDYYTGHPYDINLAAEINRIVDDAKLPRPAADIIHRLGVGDPHNPRDPEIKRVADLIVHNYDSPQESGTEVLRRVVANVDMINALPADERAKIMGWTNLPEPEKEALGWVKEPPPDQKAAMGWDQMSPEQQEAFRWAHVHVDVHQVLGQMENKTLADSSNAALLQNLTPQVEALRHDRQVEVEQLQNQQSQLNDQRKGADGQHGALGDLTDQTKAGVSFGTKVENFFNNGRDSEFDARQTELLKRLHDIDDQIAANQKKLQEAQESQGGLALAKEVGEYRRLLNIGDQVAADKLAISMWKEHGPELAVLAPEVWHDLTVSTDNTLQGQSMLQRLKDRSEAQVGVVPGYDTGENGLKQALGMAPAANGSDPMGLLQLQDGKLDSDALRAYMLGRVDQDETLRKVSDASRDIGQDLEELSTMFVAAQTGSAYETFIADAKDRAAKINKVLDGFTDADRQALKQKIQDLETAEAAMKNKPGADQKALKELDERLNTYKQMAEILDPNSPTRKMLHDIENNKLRPDTITKWLKENGVTIGVAIAACAATVSACATFGITSPAAVGLWVAVGGLVAREATNEVLYQVNKDGYTGYGDYDNQGSRVGAWYRHLDPNDVAKDLQDLGLHVAVPYAVEIARDWAAFVGTFGLSKYFFSGGASGGFTKAMASIFETPPANLAQLANLAERASLLESGQYGDAAASYIKQFMNQFGKELAVNAGFTGAQTGAQTAVDAAIGPENVAKLGELGQFGLSFAISTALAMGAGYRHQRILENAQLKPGNVLDFTLSPGAKESDFIDYMKRQGYIVNQTSPGHWDVQSATAPPGSKPIQMVDNTGKPAEQQGDGGNNNAKPGGDSSTPPQAVPRPANDITPFQNKLDDIGKALDAKGVDSAQREKIVAALADQLRYCDPAKLAKVAAMLDKLENATDFVQRSQAIAALADNPSFQRLNFPVQKLLSDNLSAQDLEALNRLLNSPQGAKIISPEQISALVNSVKPGFAQRCAALERVLNHPKFADLNLPIESLLADSLPALNDAYGMLDNRTFQQMLSDPKLRDSVRELAESSAFRKLMNSDSTAAQVQRILIAKAVDGTLHDYVKQVDAIGNSPARQKILEFSLLGAPVNLSIVAEAGGESQLNPLNALLYLRQDLINMVDGGTSGSSKFPGMTQAEASRIVKVIDRDLSQPYLEDKYLARAQDLIVQLKQLQKPTTPAQRASLVNQLEQPPAQQTDAPAPAPQPQLSQAKIEQLKAQVKDQPDGAKIVDELLSLGVSADLLTTDPQAAFKPNGPADLMRLRDELEAKLAKGELPAGLDKAQMQRLIDAVDAIARGSGPAAPENRLNQSDKDKPRDAWIQTSEQAVQVIKDLLAPGGDPQRARLAIDLLDAQSKYPLQLPILRMLSPDYPIENVRFLLDKLNELSGLTPPEGRQSDRRAWGAGVELAAALARTSDPALKDWVFVPAEAGSPTDLAGMDGMLINLKDGTIRPIDFKNDQLRGSHATEDPRAPFNLFIGSDGNPINAGNAESILRDFLSRSSDAAIPAQAREKIAQVLGAFPLAMRTSEGVTDQQVEATRKYLDCLHELANQYKQPDGQPAPWLRRLTQSAEGYLHKLEGAELTLDSASTGLSQNIEIKPTKNAKGQNTLTVGFANPWEVSPSVKFDVIDKPPGNYLVKSFVIDVNGEVRANVTDKLRGTDVQLDLGSWADVKKALEQQLANETDPTKAASIRTNLALLDKTVNNFVH